MEKKRVTKKMEEEIVSWLCVVKMRKKEKRNTFLRESVIEKTILELDRDFVSCLREIS